MKSNVWFQQALTMSVVFALVVTFSMVALANAGNAVGELTVIRSASANETSSVTVNGEVAKSGRTVFSSSTISTPEGMEAIINFGKAGKIQIEPDTTFTLAADSNSINGDLAKGSLTVLNAANAVTVKTAAGDVVNVKAGETASATSGTAAKKPGPAGLDWWVWAAIVGGAVTIIIIAANSGNNNTSVASPVR